MEVSGTRRNISRKPLSLGVSRMSGDPLEEEASTGKQTGLSRPNRARQGRVWARRAYDASAVTILRRIAGPSVASSEGLSLVLQDNAREAWEKTRGTESNRRARERGRGSSGQSSTTRLSGASGIAWTNRPSNGCRTRTRRVWRLISPRVCHVILAAFMPQARIGTDFKIPYLECNHLQHSPDFRDIPDQIHIYN
jgi:hypothetical protein